MEFDQMPAPKKLDVGPTDSYDTPKPKEKPPQTKGKHDGEIEAKVLRLDPLGDRVNRLVLSVGKHHGVKEKMIGYVDQLRENYRFTISVVDEMFCETIVNWPANDSKPGTTVWITKEIKKDPPRREL